MAVDSTRIADRVSCSFVPVLLKLNSFEKLKGVLVKNALDSLTIVL